METTINSLLCRERWYWDSNNESYIKFFENGTGHLVARRGLSIFIAAYFTWRPRSPSRLNDVINISSESQDNIYLLGILEIEIELSKRRVQEASNINIDRYKINECLLSEEAFNSNNQYTVRLEKGSFMTVDDTKNIDKMPYFCRYSYRLLFEPSPFPPRHLWREDAGKVPQRLGAWEWKQFLAGISPPVKQDLGALRDKHSGKSESSQ